MGIAGMIGPAIFSTIFSVAISQAVPVQFPGAPFLVAALLHLVAIVIFVRFRPPAKQS